MCGNPPGLATDKEQLVEILAAVEDLRALGAGQDYTRNPLLCGSWRLVFTTEKARWEALLTRKGCRALP